MPDSVRLYHCAFARSIRNGFNLVGDSLAKVFQGQETTLPVTLDEMIYHAKTVVRGVDRAMVIIDMPFMSYQANDEEGFRNAGRIMKETGAGGVKLEGGERSANLVHIMVVQEFR